MLQTTYFKMDFFLQNDLDLDIPDHFQNLFNLSKLYLAVLYVTLLPGTPCQLVRADLLVVTLRCRVPRDNLS